MHSFVDLDRSLGAVPSSVVIRLRRVDRGQGSEDLFRNQVPDLLTGLANRARVSSITASSALEGIVVPDRARAAAIIDGRAAVLRTRSEQELAGYRAALDYLFASDWRPLNAGLLLLIAWVSSLVGITFTVGGFPPDLSIDAIVAAVIGGIAISIVGALVGRAVPD